MPWNNITENAKTRANDADSTTMNVFDAWFRPGVVQQYEFGQQVALQEMQNDWNSELAKMERMKEAGINLNTAASGIAGAGASPSTGSVPSAMSAGASQAGSALGSLGSAAAGIIGESSQAFDRLFTLHPRRKQLLSQAKLNFANTGFTDLQSKGLTIALKYANQKEYLGLMNLQSNLLTAGRERAFITARIKNLDEQNEELKARVQKYEHENNLADKQAAEAEMHANEMEQLKIMYEFRNNLNKLAGVDTTLPLPNMAAQLFFQGKDDMLDKFLDHVYEYNYQVNAGSFDAEADAAFDKAWNEELGKLNIDADFMPFMTQLEVLKDGMKELLKASFENPDDLKGLVAKYFNQMLNTVMSAFQMYSMSIVPSYIKKYNDQYRPRRKPRQRGSKGTE